MFNETELKRMELCGKCDGDQEDLCSDCPARIPADTLVALGVSQNDDGIITSYAPRASEMFPMLNMGRARCAPPPMLHDHPPAPETIRGYARKLLRLKSREVIGLRVAHAFTPTIQFLESVWAERCPEDAKSHDCDRLRNKWVMEHPFIKFLTHLVRIKLLPAAADSSFLQAERVMDGIAEV